MENQALTFSWRFQSKGRRILPEILVCQDGIEFLTNLTLAPSDFLRPHECQGKISLIVGISHIVKCREKKIWEIPTICTNSVNKNNRNFSVHLTGLEPVRI